MLVRVASLPLKPLLARSWGPSPQVLLNRRHYGRVQSCLLLHLVQGVEPMGTCFSNLLDPLKREVLSRMCGSRLWSCITSYVHLFNEVLYLQASCAALQSLIDVGILTDLWVF